jgi:hypothetical protein
MSVEQDNEKETEKLDNFGRTTRLGDGAAYFRSKLRGERRTAEVEESTVCGFRKLNS